MSTATLPPWRSALAVVAHPDDESFALGAVISELVGAGTTVSVLCLTRGEASTLGAVEDLSTVRTLELARAAEALGVTGHADHARATEAALAAAADAGLPDLGWTVPAAVAATLNAAFDGHEPADVDVVVPVDRTRQLEAVQCHASQAVPGSVFWRRLELLGSAEHLRVLAGPAS
nr:PIG-L family deacetylase [uncultured Actinotalea sp.]